MPRRTDIRKIMIVGSGPIVIGQACEFDYSGTQACKALKEEGYEIVLLNSNPATIMTDPGFADRTYVEPITPATAEQIIAREKPDVLLPTLGGQTALNLAVALAKNGALERHGVGLIGASLEPIARRALALSPTHTILCEESIIGWKEYELEVMRDRKDNVVIICSIENLDPMGVHTGDSITVAPAQTLTDKEYQVLRDASIRIIREIGVETGGSNIQFGVHPRTGRMVVIEMNPRVSRSSALASKATGFPIAKIAAKLAVGYTLDEIKNDITRYTPASFKPTIDYVVTKVPRFAFEKFPGADESLGPQMKSVGEVMAIGRTFKEALLKGVRALDTGKRVGSEQIEPKILTQRLVTPHPERLAYVQYAIRQVYPIKQSAKMTSIDPWFLYQLKEINDMQLELEKHPMDSIPTEVLRDAKH